MKKFRPTAVDVAIINEDKILLVKRKKPPFKGKWVLPGGFVEINENINQAAIREAKEETGLDIEIIGIIGVYSNPKRDERHTISIAFLGIPNTDKLDYDKEEISEIKWFSFDKIPKLGFDHNEIVNDAINIYKQMQTACYCCSNCR